MAFAVTGGTNSTIFWQSQPRIASLSSSSKRQRNTISIIIQGKGITTMAASNRLVILSSANASQTDFHPQPQLNIPPDTNFIPGSSWAEFAENVSGEWDGFGADFTKDGKVKELPESVVPEAYKEWEVKVFDWQTQCPTLAQPAATPFDFFYKLIWLHPTVGCEADAATRYRVDERNVSSGAAAFAYRTNGCYVALWPAADDYSSSGKLLELEHCLVDPRDRESRVRIVQVLRVRDGKLELEKIQVFCELWYGPFRNGDQLGACSVRNSAFASTPHLESSQVSGVWQGLNAIARFPSQQNTVCQQLLEESVPQKALRDGSRLVLLPKQLWCSLDEGEGVTTCCQVGWLLDRGLAITSKCSFSAGAQLKEIAIACETAEST